MEKFIAERKKAMSCLLQESYKKAAQEDRVVSKEWDIVSGEGID